MMPRIGSWLSVPSSWNATPANACPSTSICLLNPADSRSAAWLQPSCCAPGSRSCRLVKLRSGIGRSMISFAVEGRRNVRSIGLQLTAPESALTVHRLRRAAHRSPSLRVHGLRGIGIHRWTPFALDELLEALAAVTFIVVGIGNQVVCGVTDRSVIRLCHRLPIVPFALRRSRRSVAFGIAAPVEIGHRARRSIHRPPGSKRESARSKCGRPEQQGGPDLPTALHVSLASKPICMRSTRSRDLKQT